MPAGSDRLAQNVLREDVRLPACVLRDGALERNITRFQRFTESTGVLLCPHAKTAMAPALFGRQLAAGCWGLTFATCAQLEVARRHGVPRVFYANELVGASDIRYVCGELARDPGFDFYCLADSVAGVRLLADGVAAAAPGRPVQVLVEGGLAGGRCGVRHVGTAVAVAEAVRAAEPHLVLVGVEGFEGLAVTREAGRPEAGRPEAGRPQPGRSEAGRPQPGRSEAGRPQPGRSEAGRPQPGRSKAGVREFLGFLARIAVALDERGLFGDRPEGVLLSAGGSAFYDLVIETLAGIRLSRPHRVVVRSGCYLTQDFGLYERLLDDLHRRSGTADPDLEPALEVWAQVLSVPEPGLVILSAGRRDFGQDAGNPVALAHVRRGSASLRSLQGAGWTMAAASDQHAHMAAPPGHGAGVGDLVALGPSHPCTTFDKWRELYLVDDAYNVLATIPTYF